MDHIYTIYYDPCRKRDLPAEVKMDLVTEYYARQRQQKNHLPYWAYRILRNLGFSVQYFGKLYRPYRLHQWAPLYDQLRNGSPEQRRQARLRQLPTSTRWFDAFGQARRHWLDRCAICGEFCNPLRDHIVPISHAECPGSVPSNMMPLCHLHNRLKYNNDLATWLEQQGFAQEEILRIVRHVWDWQEYCWKCGWR